jgi:hypothetical protein
MNRSETTLDSISRNLDPVLRATATLASHVRERTTELVTTVVADSSVIRREARRWLARALGEAQKAISR